jgi:hypothetical protein
MKKLLYTGVIFLTQFCSAAERQRLELRIAEYERVSFHSERAGTPKSTHVLPTPRTPDGSRFAERTLQKGRLGMSFLKEEEEFAGMPPLEETKMSLKSAPVSADSLDSSLKSGSLGSSTDSLATHEDKKRMNVLKKLFGIRK